VLEGRLASQQSNVLYMPDDFPLFQEARSVLQAYGYQKVSVTYLKQRGLLNKIYDNSDEQDWYRDSIVDHLLNQPYTYYAHDHADLCKLLNVLKKRRQNTHYVEFNEWGDRYQLENTFAPDHIIISDGDLIIQNVTILQEMFHTLENAQLIVNLENQFGNRNKISSENIPQTVKRITLVNPAGKLYSTGDYFAYNCISLTSIIISDFVIDIGDYFALNCKELTSIILPNFVIHVRSWFANNCTSLKSIILPNSVTCIRYYFAYRCTGLTSIIISDSVTAIGENFATDCFNLKEISCADETQIELVTQAMREEELSHITFINRSALDG
jgi:hypothetical protein